MPKDMILLFISNLVMLLIGFGFGYLANSERIRRTQTRMRELMGHEEEYGVVNPPTAEQLKKRGTLIEEEEQAVEESLDKLMA